MPSIHQLSIEDAEVIRDALQEKLRQAVATEDIPGIHEITLVLRKISNAVPAMELRAAELADSPLPGNSALGPSH